MLEAQDLSKRYGSQTALDRLNLTILPGEVFCLLGANGAGTTATINLFLNFINPTSGTARINGLVVTRAPLETKKHLAYIPEQVMLYRNLTGLENLEYFTALAGHEYPRSRYVELFRQVGLAQASRTSASARRPSPPTICSASSASSRSSARPFPPISIAREISASSSATACGRGSSRATHRLLAGR